MFSLGRYYFRLAFPLQRRANQSQLQSHPQSRAHEGDEPTPEFTVATPDGKKISLKDFRGKIVFLNFWASWCEPCREEMPEMEKLYQEFKAKNFVVVAIAVKDRKQDTLDFVKEFKITFPIGLDPEGNAGSYGAWGLPTTY